MNWKRLSALPRNIVLHIAGLTLFFWLYHKFAVYVIKTLKIKLGGVEPPTAPLYSHLQTSFSSWVIPAIITMIVYIIIFRVFFEKRKVPAYLLLPVCILLFVLIDTTVAMIDGGMKPFVEPYTRNTLEYYADVPKVKGARQFLRDYVEIFDTLSWHARTHPPGGVLFLWLGSLLFGRGLIQAAFFTVAFTSLTVIPVYFLSKERYGEGAAKYALGLFLITPNMVMFTATGMDGPFSVFPILSVYLFYKALSGKTVIYSILTGIALGFGMLMNYTTLFIGIFFIIVTLITLIGKRDKIKTTLMALFISGGTFVVFYLLLYLWAKYNFISALLASYKKDEGSLGTGYETSGHYFHISLANLLVFLIGVGAPLVTIWLHEIIAEFSRIIRSRKVDTYILAYIFILLGMSFSTLFTLEVERIWIFTVPFIVIPAAKHLYERHRLWEFYVVAGLSYVQILLGEIFLYTHW